MMEEVLHGMANLVSFMRNSMADDVGLVAGRVCNRMRLVGHSVIDSLRGVADRMANFMADMVHRMFRHICSICNGMCRL